MNDNVSVLPVDPEELLSRYILQKSHIRQDNTLRADPFIPHPYADLSVTRHLKLGERDLWEIGEKIARQIGKFLYGRAESLAKTYNEKGLTVRAAPVLGNPNHANITGWPAEKPAQKIIALELAATSRYIPKV